MKSKKVKEQTSNKVLAAFIAGAVMLCLFSYLHKSLDIPISYHTTHTAVLILSVVFFVAFICSFICFFVSNKKDTFKSEKIFNPLFLSCLFLAAAVCSLFLYVDYFLAMKFIYVFIPALVIFYLVYNVYQKSFFWLLLTHGIITLMLYLISQTESTLYKFVAGGLSVLVCACAVSVYFASKKTGKLSLWGKKAKIFEPTLIPSKNAVLLIYGITLAIVIACIFLPSFIVTYVFYASAVILVCCAVYYTFRLM